METMYWIDVIGNISTTTSVFAGLSIFAVLVCLIFMFLAFSEGELADVEYFKKWLKRFGIASMLLVVVAIIAPSQKSMYAIYGIGGTIDYIKNNDTAKELPDKVVIALDKYIDRLNEDKEEKND